MISVVLYNNTVIIGGSAMAVSYCDVHLNSHQKETNQHGDIFFPIACYEDDMAQVDVPIHWHGELE